MGVADRARTRIPQQGDYLDKDDLIRAQDEPFGIASVVYDEKGSNYGARWVLSLIPWFDDQEDPKGLLTFTANPTRNPFMEDLQAQIEENDNEPIGPCVLVKGKSTKGFRFYTIDDWKETPEESTPAPAPARPARPARPAASATEPGAAVKDVPPQSVPANDAPKKRGRPRKSTTTSSTPEPASTAAPLPASREPGPGEAAQATQISTPNVATVICPDCHQEVTGRVLPDDKGKFFVIHPFCPTLGKGTIVEVAV